MDFPLCLRSLAVDLCVADGRPVQLQLQSAGQHSEHGHRRRTGVSVANLQRSLADRVRQSLWWRDSLSAHFPGD